MPQIAIEYMIMVPVLILQIFIFPMTASVIMNTYVDSRLTIELQATAGHMGSSIQQLYYTIDHGSISDGSMKITLDTWAALWLSLGSRKRPGLEYHPEVLRRLCDSFPGRARFRSAPSCV